ncbi:uncharacterized protein LOC108738048 isoform X2 [Agrilus planipennis]|nr:uncharacterized protein LOC108738048 isoform X2 [Agrilus planipennis]
METIDEPIKNLLQSTGWTVGDLLGKLQKYQTKNEGGISSQDIQNCNSAIGITHNRNNNLNNNVAENGNKEKSNAPKKNDFSTRKKGKINQRANINNVTRNFGHGKKILKNCFAIQKFILANKQKYNLKSRILRLQITKILRKYRKYYKKLKRKPTRNVILLKPVEKPRKDIRDKIKEQLELLRNKKKEPLSLPKPIFSNVPSHIKKRPSLKISEFLLEKFCDNSNDSNEINYFNANSSATKKRRPSFEANSSRKNSVSENSDDSRLVTSELFESTSNDFIITNVMGGYKSPEEEFPDLNSPESKNNSEEKAEDVKVYPFINIDNNNDSDKPEQDLTLVNGRLKQEPIWPTKTKDVTKIKGWQKKKFVLPETVNESESKNYEVVYTTSPIPSTSLNRKTYVQSKTEVTGNKTNESSELIQCDSKSVFISDSLDQYLNKNAKLNISYEVPKLIAEEAVTQPSLVMPLGYSKMAKTGMAIKVKSDIYKPKTLAEKRKIMSGELEPILRERRKQSEELEMKLFDVQKVVKNVSQPPRVIYNECPVILTTTDPFTKSQFKRAKNKKDFYRTFIYNRKRLKVVSTSEQKVVGRIFDNFMINPPKQYISMEEKNRVIQNTKPSLLRCLEENKIDNVTYKPGPLCHKIKLQKNLQSQWKTFIVKLPQIFVEIEPRFRKPVQTRVRELIKNNDVILDKDRVDFALSALKGAEPINRAIKFPLSYANNQKCLMLRRKIPIEQDDKEMFVPIAPLTDEQQTTEEIIKNVVDRMLDYVDTKEVEQAILKDDPDLKGTLEREGITPPSPIGTNISTIIKKPSYGRKKSRTALELKRLNVKIIEVDVEDPENNATCEKEYCKMGCVCTSLQCNPSSLVQEHCGMEKCMLSCACKSKRNNKENKLTLPVGTNILSAHVVNHLQDVAKKDLAKVEKEFTQTVIKANNQTIVVGTDPKERLRRVTKVPKRYNDFVHKEVIPGIVERISDVKEKPQCILKDVIVNLKRYKFDIIPFCLVHEQYNCKCSCKSVFSDMPQIVLRSPNKDTTNEFEQFKKEDSDDETIDVCKSNYRSEDLIKNSCSRTKGLATDYYLERNKSSCHLRKIQRSTRKLYIARNKHYFEKGENMKLADKVSPTRKNKRKQIFTELRDFDESEKRSKLNESVPINSFNATTSNNVNSIPTVNNESQQNLSIGPKPIEHDLLQDLRTNKADLGKNLCLMSWKTLRVKFNNNTLFVWQSYSNYDPEILITSRQIAPALGFMNIKVLTKISKQFINTNHIVRWLTTGLPFEKMEENLLVILSMGEKSCKICGVCEKLENSNKYRLIETNSKEMFNVSTGRPNPLQIDLTADEVTSNSTNTTGAATSTTAATTTSTNIEKRKDIQENRKRVLFFSRHKYEKLHLISESQINLHKDQQNPVNANLPYIEGGCRWRLIELENPFTYLYFVRSNYSIRYVDLLKAPSMVSDNNVTINLKSTEMRKNYIHPRFGIFCMPRSSKEVFVGPYGYKEDHDLEILTYMNKVLVNTDLYNQIKGGGGLKNGAWYYQAEDPYGSNDEDNDDVQIVQEQPTCIDLTGEDIPSDTNSSENNEEKHEEDNIKKSEEEFNTKIKEEDSEENENKNEKNKEQCNKEKDESKNVDDKINCVSKSIKKVKLPSLSEKDSELAKIMEFLDEWEKYPSNRALIVPNVKDLGCIKVLRCPMSQTFKVFCPFSNTIRTYSKLSGAVRLFEKELNEVLTPVPANFILKCTVTYPKEGESIVQIDRNVLQGDHIIGEFGVKHIKEAPLLYIDQFAEHEEEMGTTNVRETKEAFDQYKKFAYDLLKIPTIQKCKDSASIIRLAIREILELQLMEKRYKNERVVHELKKAELMSKYANLVKKNANGDLKDPLGSLPLDTEIKESPLKESSLQPTTVNNDDTVKPFINLTESSNELENTLLDTSPEKTNNIVGKKLKLISRKNSIAGPSAIFKRFSSSPDKSSSESDRGVVLPVKAYLKSSSWTKEVCLMPPRSKRLRERLQKKAEEESKASKMITVIEPKKANKSLRAWRKGSGKNSGKQTNNVIISVQPTLTSSSSVPSNVTRLQYSTTEMKLSATNTLSSTTASVGSGDSSKLRFIKIAPNNAEVKVPIQFVNSSDSKVIPVKLHFPSTSILKTSLQNRPKPSQNVSKN